MKKIILTLSIVLNIMLIGVIANAPETLTATAETKAPAKITIADTWYQEDGDMIVDLTDGSWIAYNPEKGQYVFQPVDMGDWDYVFTNQKDLTNAVSMYIELANNPDAGI